MPDLEAAGDEQIGESRRTLTVDVEPLSVRRWGLESTLRSQPARHITDERRAHWHILIHGTL